MSNLYFFFSSTSMTIRIGDISPCFSTYLKLICSSNRLYIEPNGSVGYTQGRSASIPDGSLFGITAFENGAFTYGGAPWRACPIEGSDPPQWEVFADLPGLSFDPGCIAFEGLVKDDTSGRPGAWAYT